MSRCHECIGERPNNPAIASERAACNQFKTMAEAAGLEIDDKSYAALCSAYRIKRTALPEVRPDHELFKGITGQNPHPISSTEAENK